MDTDAWHEICVVVDRTNNVIRVGTINGEMSAVFSDSGSLTSGRAFSLYQGRILGLVGDIMGCRVALGAQVEGRSPKAIAQVVAKLIWWDDVFVRAASDAK